MGKKSRRATKEKRTDGVSDLISISGLFSKRKEKGKEMDMGKRKEGRTDGRKEDQGGKREENTKKTVI